MNPRQFTITIAIFSDDMIDACRVREHIADAVALRGSVGGELVYVGSVLEVQPAPKIDAEAPSVRFDASEVVL